MGCLISSLILLVVAVWGVSNFVHYMRWESSVDDTLDVSIMFVFLLGSLYLGIIAIKDLIQIWR